MAHDLDGWAWSVELKSSASIKNTTTYPMSLAASLEYISAARHQHGTKHTAVSTENSLLMLQLQTLQDLIDAITTGVGGNNRPFRGKAIKLGDDLLLQLQILRDALYSTLKITPRIRPLDSG